MTEPEWYRQPGIACEFCGKPGHLIPIAPPMVTAATFTDEPDLGSLTITTRMTCPEHRPLVRQRAEREQDPERFAYDHGRPGEWGETGPERTRKALRTLVDRLGESDDPKVREAVPPLATDTEEKA